MTRKKRDANHNEIADLFRQLGASVSDVTQGESVGYDLVIGVQGHSATIEIKADSKRNLTEIEKEHSRTWNGKHAVVHDAAGVLLVFTKLASGKRFPLECPRNGW